MTDRSKLISVLSIREHSERKSRRRVARSGRASLLPTAATRDRESDRSWGRFDALSDCAESVAEWLMATNRYDIEKARAVVDTWRDTNYESPPEFIPRIYECLDYIDGQDRIPNPKKR